MTAASSEALPYVVADTHALLWYLLGSSRLGQQAQAVLQRVDVGQTVLVIPAVVLAELFMVAEKGRIALTSAMLIATARAWQAASNIRLTHLTPALVVASIDLTAIPDIFDRLIVAEARALGVPLITQDAVVVRSQLVPIIW